MSIHTGEGDYFGNMRLDYDKAFSLLEQKYPHLPNQPRPFGRAAWKNKLLLRAHAFLQEKKLFEPLTQLGIRRFWFEEFLAFWRDFLGGRPLTVMDFHQLRFHYRLLFQEIDSLDWNTTEQHMENWKRHKNFYLLFGVLYAHSLSPQRDLSFLNPSGPNRVLEYGCSHAPYYRAWRAYHNHIPAFWTLADIKNISFMFSRYSYRNDAPIERFVTIDENNLENPLESVNGAYDTIILTTVLEHVHSPLAIAQMLTDKLKTGGKLLFDYIKSDATGLDSTQGKVQRRETLEYLDRMYTVVSGDFQDFDRDIGLCLGIKK